MFSHSGNYLSKINTLEVFYAGSQYLTYLWNASGANGIHSPFVFELYNEVIRHPYHFYAFEEIEQERHRLLASRSKLEYEDLGAIKTQVSTSVSALARRSLMPVEEAIVLFQLAFWLKPHCIVELGTCLGITTAYLAKSGTASVYTFEGIPALLKEAREVWQNLNLTAVHSIEGKIEDTFPDWLQSAKPKIDLLILDANHSYEATMENFTKALPYLHPGSCVVVDDLYWSKEMTTAWSEIKNHPKTTLALDFYRFGLVFFRSENRKENFVLRW